LAKIEIKEKFPKQEDFELVYNRAKTELNNNPEISPLSSDAILPIHRPIKGKLSTRELFVLGCVYDNERGMARLFSQLLLGQALWNFSDKIWMLYNGVFWENDELHGIPKLGIEKLHFELQSLKQSCSVLSMDAPDGDNKYQGYLTIISKQISALNKRNGMINVEKIAMDFMPVLSDKFDRQDKLLNFKNGIYDLDSHTFQEHDWKHLLKKHLEFDHNIKSKCPKWTAFVEKILFGDKKTIRYLYQFLGVALTNVSPDEFVIMYGSGGNGKSVFLDTISDLLGNYAAMMKSDLLIKSQFENAKDYHICPLAGARFVKAIEAPGGQLDNNFIKQLTGGGTEAIVARQPFGRVFQIFPTHSLVVTCNTLPRINAGDHGIRRRPKVIEFKYRFNDNERREKEDIAKEFKLEYSGIVNLMIAGWKDYQENNGFTYSEKVVSATKDYVSNSNVVDEFVEKYLVKDINGKCTTIDVYRRFVEFCDENAYRLPFRGQRSFNRELQQLDSFDGDKKVADGFTYWYGYYLQPDDKSANMWQQ